MLSRKHMNCCTQCCMDWSCASILVIYNGKVLSEMILWCSQRFQIRLSSIYAIHFYGRFICERQRASGHFVSKQGSLSERWQRKRGCRPKEQRERGMLWAAGETSKIRGYSKNFSITRHNESPQRPERPLRALLWELYSFQILTQGHSHRHPSFRYFMVEIKFLPHSE